MRIDFKAAAAGLLALAGMMTLSVGAAEAKTWRQWAQQYGGGSYVDKYANDYVGEDKNGRTIYKGSKHDTWSGDYYNTKTGKWTGKKYDGEGGGKSASLSDDKPAKKKSASLKSGKSASTKTYASKSSASGKSGVVTTADAKSTRPADAASGVSTAAQVAQSAAHGAAGAEVYGPPIPEDFAANGK